MVLYKRRNSPGYSHLIIHGNESHQQDKRRKKALHLSSKRCVCSDGWNPKLSSPQTQIRAFVFFPVIRETKTPLASGLDHIQGCWALGDLLTGFGSAWEERCHLSSLALGRQEDTPQLYCEDRKVVFGSSLFMYMHAQRVHVPHWACVIPTECKSRAKEWGRIYCLVHFHLEVFRVFGA